MSQSPKKKPRKVVELPSFDGIDKEEARQWLIDYDKYMSTRGYDDQDRQRFASLCLLNKARNWYDTTIYIEPNIDWVSLKQRFLAHFCGSIYVELADAKQRDNETPSEYLVRIVAKCLKIDHVNITEDLIITKILSGLKKNVKDKLKKVSMGEITLKQLRQQLDNYAKEGDDQSKSITTIVIDDEDNSPTIKLEHSGQETSDKSPTTGQRCNSYIPVSQPANFNQSTSSKLQEQLFEPPLPPTVNHVSHLLRPRGSTITETSTEKNKFKTRPCLVNRKVKRYSKKNPLRGCPNTTDAKISDNYMRKILKHTVQPGAPKFLVQWDNLCNWIHARTIVKLEPKSLLIHYIDRLKQKEHKRFLSLINKCSVILKLDYPYIKSNEEKCIRELDSESSEDDEWSYSQRTSI